MYKLRVRLEGIKPIVSIKKCTSGIDGPTTKRAVRQIYRRWKRNTNECHADLRPFYDAILAGTLPQYYYGVLKEKRAWCDDLPFHENSIKRLELGRNHPSYPHLKCRGNCIVSISLTLQATIYEGLVKDHSVIEAVEAYRYYDWNAFKGKGKAWTTPEEIALINKTLDIVIGYLETEYKLE